MTAKTKTSAKPRRDPKGPDHYKPFRYGATGAPTTFEECFCERVVYAGTHGMSLAQIAHDLGTTRTTVVEWGERHPAFASSLLRARDASLAWWETQGMKGMWAGKDFNDRWAKFAMTNLFRQDYKERVEVSGALAKIDFGRMTDEQLAAIAQGQHPYEVLAPRRELLTEGEVDAAEASEVIDAQEVGPEEFDVAQPTKREPPPGESEGDL